MKDYKAKAIINELKEANVIAMNPSEIFDSPSIKGCSPLLKYNGMIKRVCLDNILDQVRNGKTYNHLKWFDILEYTSGNSKNKYKCLCCDTIFTKEGKKLKEGKEPCPNCGVSEKSDVNPMKILKDCKQLHCSDRHYIDKKGTIVSTVGHFKYIVPSTKKDGHQKVSIKGKSYAVHRLVLEAFGKPQPGPDFVVRHLNDIPDDNRLENLQWGLQKRNMADKKVNQKRLEEAIRDSYEKGIDIKTLSVLTSYSTETLKAILES